ncbi:Flagellin [Candidatus Magnetaquicoccaceae bacterium FCR-1]|uniref:Flagellin n=1 Tax=Candidatus Magnetaquiglobus chichijimensis TaxID=3141448 RepID=A0ABQ0C522_9PROT
MPLFINTNVASLNAQRNLERSTGALGQTFARLSSGLRINSAKDDAAGLAISNRMTSQIRGLNQAIRNANDGISLAQVAEGALLETGNSLQRIRELAVEAANGTNTPEDRADLQKEVSQLLSEIQRVSEQVQFNNTLILNGNYNSGQQFQIGANANQTITVSIKAATYSALFGTGVSVNIGTVSGANSALVQITNALNSVSDIRANLGAIQNRFEAVIANLSNVVENMSAARSRILDADIANETATLTRNAILQQAGTAVLAQANQQPQLALQLLGK